ncbi:MAG: hypothetical protein L0Z51_08350 [Candidatus Latescibacteria bacterium]|nr:hypothetical protein [Candidatus Latescibacterota bacterium]
MEIGIPKTGSSKVLLGTLWLALAGSPSIVLAGPEAVALANGLSATLYPADYLRDRVVTTGDETAIELDDDRLIPVIVDINDPSIANKGDGEFHPFSTDDVLATLRALDHRSLRMSIRVYLLPYPRRSLLVSSTSGGELFLSPHVLSIDPSVAAYIVAHELGHAFHNRFMPDGSPAWEEYRALRGITDTARFHDRASHAYRPKEILAEDFRVFFGGESAYFGGYVENPEIARPETVAGLENFFLRVAAEPVAPRAPRIFATSFPNPFNPATEVRVSLPDELAGKDQRVSVRVYSVTGALVRDLYDGRAMGDFAVRWDGTDNRGNRVASATYYAAVIAGGSKETVKLVLLK